jgi:hypothetical protein
MWGIFFVGIIQKITKRGKNMSTELSTSKRFCKIAAFKHKSSKSIAFLVAGVLLLLAIDAAYNIGYGFVYGLGLLLTVLTFTLTLIIDNFFLLLEAASIITGYVAAGACVVASIACFNMAISNDKKNKLESADIEYDQNCLVFYTSKNERYVLTEIKTIYAKGEKYHIDGKAAKYTTQLGKSHTVHLDIIPATYQNFIYLCNILNNITQGTNQNK